MGRSISRTNALVATPYLKKRKGGQVNRFSRRHAQRNQQFLSVWDPARSHEEYLRQFVPIQELHISDLALVPDHLRHQNSGMEMEERLWYGVW